MVHNFVSMLASMMHHQGKDYHHQLVYIFSDYILIICNHLFGDTKNVFFNAFNTSKLLLQLSVLHKNIYIYLSPTFHNIHNLLFSGISLLTFSFRHHVCFLLIPFSVHLQVFSVAESKSCFNLNQTSSTCSPGVSLISPVKVSQNLSPKSAF